MAKATIEMKVSIKWWAKPILFICVLLKLDAPSWLFSVEVVK